MRKHVALVILASAVMASAPVFADTGAAGTSDQTVYHSNVPATPIWRNREFWHNEKERSGLPQFWDGTKRFFKSINPAPFLQRQRERYDERRASSSSAPAASSRPASSGSSY